MKKIRGLFVLSFGWLVVVSVAISNGWLPHDEVKSKKLTKSVGDAEENTSQVAEGSWNDDFDENNESDLIIGEAGTLAGLTNQGKTQPVLLVPRHVRKIKFNSLRECSPKLVRIILEERHGLDLQIDQGVFNSLSSTVSFFVSETDRDLALKNTLVNAGVDATRIFSYQTDESRCFYLTPSLSVSEATVLIGLTPKCQKLKTTALTVPSDVVELADYAFNKCPEMVDEINLATEQKVAAIAPQAFSDLKHVKKIKVKQKHTGVQLVLSGINSAKIQIIIDELDGQSEIEVVDQFILATKQDQEKSLLGLTKSGQTAQKLVIPAVVQCIEEDSLATAVASAIEFLRKDRLSIKGTLPKTHYFVSSRSMVESLVKSGVNEVNIKDKDAPFKVYVDGDYLLRNHANGEIELYGLSPSGQKKEHLAITSKINLIGDEAWINASVSQLDFESDAEVKINADFSRDWKVSAKNVKTALNLLNHQLKQVHLKKNGEEVSWFSEGGNVYQSSAQSAPTKWIGVLNNQKEKEKLVISPKAAIVGVDAFAGIKAKSIRFEYDGAVKFEGNDVPNVEYEVKHEVTADALRNRGVDKSVTITKQNLRFVEWIDHGCILRSEGPNRSLIGLTGEFNEKEFIEISEKVNFVYKNALADSKAKKIKFSQDNLVRFEEGIPNVLYEVSNLANAFELIKAGVTNEIFVNTTGESFVIRVKDDCILKINKSGVSLLGLSPEGKFKKSLIIPEEVKVVLKDAFSYTKAEKITFQSFEPVKFNGEVPDVIYVVNHQDTAQNLRAYKLTNAVIINEANQTFTEQLKGHYWLSSDQAGVTRLVALTSEAHQEKVLVIPSEVSLISQDVFQAITAEKIILQSPKTVVFEGKMPDVDYEVKQIETAINLFNAGVSHNVVISESDQDVVLHNQDGVIFRTDQSQDTTLVCLKKPGQTQEELVIPANINVIGENALVDAEATKVIFDYEGEVKINGLIANKHYVVKHENTINNLIKAGVKLPVTFSKDGQVFTEENQNGLIVRRIDQRTILQGLTPEAQEKNLLVVPEEISLMASGALNQSAAVQITLKSDVLMIDGLVPNVNYQVRNMNIADQLIDAGVTKAIAVSEGDRHFTLQAKDGYVIKKEGDTSTLIRLKKARQESQEELEIPAEVSVLSFGSLTGTKAPMIHLLHEGEVQVDGPVANVNYSVRKFKSAFNLFKVGVTENVFVSENGEDTVVLHEDGFILQQKDNEVTLVDLLDESRHAAKLVVPQKVSAINAHALDNIAASEISLMNKQPVFIRGAMPDLKYAVGNVTTAVNLIRNQVKQKISVDDGHETFWLQADDNFILKADLSQKEIALFGLINSSLENEAILKIPESVNVFNQRALGELKSERLTFLHDGEVTIVGSVSDVHYETRNLKTAINLINAGANQVVVYENDEIYEIKALNQTIVKINQKDERLLIGLTEDGKAALDLVIPPEVLVIKKGSLSEAKAATISIENKHEVIIEEGVPNVEYKVKNVETAFNLVDQHVSKTIEVNDGLNVFKLWVKDGYVLSAGADKVVKLVNLTRAKINDEKLILPEEVSVIEENALMNTMATKLTIRRNGVVQVNGIVNDLVYDVNRRDTAINLINAGAIKVNVTEGKKISKLRVDGGLILKLNQGGQASLFGLTQAMVNKKSFILPRYVSAIEEDALKDSNADLISITCPTNFVVHGPVPEVIYEVRSTQAADELVKAGAGRTKSILIFEKKQLYVQYVSNGCVLRSDSVKLELIRLTTERQQQSDPLEVPAEVTLVGENSLKGMQASLVKFLSTNAVQINGLVPDVQYEVKRVETACALIQAGAKQPIRLIEDNQIFMVEVIEHGYVVKKDDQGIGKLVDLMPSLCQQTYLVIPASIGIIDDGALLKVNAKHIKLDFPGEVQFIGSVPNVRYELNSERSATHLLVKKAVTVPVLVSENKRHFIQKNSNNFIVQEESEKVTLVALADSLKNADELVIPAEIKFVGASALNDLKIKQIEFLSEDEVSFLGSVCDTNYRVKNLKTAINLVNHGVETGSVYVDEDKQVLVVNLTGGCIIKTNRFGVTSLLGFEHQYASTSVDIPSVVSVIEPGALTNSRISFIRILHRGDVSFNGEVPDIEYEVMNVQTARNLVALGVSKRVRINLDNELLALQAIDNCLVLFKGVLVSLIDVLDDKVKILSIANVVTSIEAKALEKCRQLTKVIFAKDSHLKEIKTDRLTRLDKKLTFFTYDQEVIKNLRAAKIDTDRIGIACGDFFVCACNQNRLIGLTASGQQNKEVVVIPGNVSFISDDAFEGCQSRIIDFTKIADANKLVIEGRPLANLKANYRVSDPRIAKKLNQAGGASNRIEMVTKKSPKHERSDRVIGITVAAVCVGILTVTLAIWLSWRNRRHKERQVS